MRGPRWWGATALFGMLVSAAWSTGWASPEVQVFTRAGCAACRQQIRVLRTVGLNPRVRAVDDDQAAHTALGDRLAALGMANVPERLPLVAVGPVSLPDDPPLARVLQHLPQPPAPWVPAGGAQRVQRFGLSPPCPAVEAVLREAGLRWEVSDALEPAVAERMWVQLRLLGHPPRQGTSLPVWIIGRRVLQGCPAPGPLAHALPLRAVLDWARATRAVDPGRFVERTLRALSTVRDRPRLGLKRLLREPGLLPGDDALAGQLTFAPRRRPLRQRPWGTLSGPILPIPDPWSPGDATIAALRHHPLSWWPGPLLGSGRLVLRGGTWVLELQLQPELP